MTEFEGMVQGVRGPEKRHHGLRDAGSVAVSTALPHVSPRPISLGPASGDIATQDEAAVPLSHTQGPVPRGTLPPGRADAFYNRLTIPTRK